MKYTLPRDLPPPTVDRDFEPPKPERLSPVFKDICGACIFLFAVLCNVYFILGL